MAIIEITSAQNSLLKEFNKLRKSSRQRLKSGKIALEGPNLVSEAVKAGLVPEVVFYTQDYYESEGKDILMVLPELSKQVILPSVLFKHISETETPQEIAAIVPFKSDRDEVFLPVSPELVLILDRLQDPGNMGAIIRTAAATGVDAVFYTVGSVDPFSPKVMRSSAGSIFHLPVLKAKEPLALVRLLKTSGLSIAAATAYQGQNLWDADFGHKTVLVIGNEAEGVKKNLLDAADLKVAVPLSEPVESLNAAVATAVILYEIIRRRGAGLT